jgi:phospholipid/cholesterol/gamma-HCH transport system substrate-binding protein
MQSRRVLIGLSLFMIVTTAMTWLVYSTLQREVSGATTPYAAVFTDAFGLREGDDVRMAGVRVGRVMRIDLESGNQAKVSFEVQSDQKVLGNTAAAVRYQNIVGQRYVDLHLGKIGEPRALPAGSVIPVERTEPSFDVGVVLNGYQPLFATIDPKAADQLSDAAIAALQGDSASWATLVDQTGKLTDTFAGRDEVLGSLITSMDKLSATLAKQNGNIDGVLANTRQMVDTFNSRRPELVASMGSMSRVARRLADITDDVYPALTSLITREPGTAAHLVTIEPQLAFTGANLPLLLKGIARATGEGAYANIYLCDLNPMGFFPGLNDVTPIIVDAATPGNKAQHTPRCRNKANG